MANKNVLRPGALFQIDVGNGYARVCVLAIGKWGPLCELFEKSSVRQTYLGRSIEITKARKALAFINPYTLEEQADYLGQSSQLQDSSSLPPYFSGYPNAFWEIHYWDGRVEEFRGDSASYDELLARGYIDSTLFALKQIRGFYQHGKPLKFSIHSKEG